MRLRIGVIGLGESWERRHKPALLRLSDKFEVRAVYDAVAQRARAQAGELDCDAADGFACLAERDDIDAVYLLGSAWHGVEPVRSACRAGKALYLERPFGCDLPYADEVIDAIRSRGVRCMVEFPWRFYPSTIRLMELLASGLGAPQLVSCTYRVVELDAAVAGRSKARSELELRDAELHLADWLRFVFLHDPVRVQSIGAASIASGPCRGFETLVAEFGGRRIGQVTLHRFASAHWLEAARFRAAPGFQVIAEHGIAFLDSATEVTWFDEAGCHEETLEMDRPLGEMLADRFYRIVEHGLHPSPGLEDAAWAREMVRQARRHAHDQRTSG